MSRLKKVPYPPSPADVPAGLTDYPESYLKQQNLLLAGLFVFLILYIGMIVFFAMVGIWCFLTLAELPALKIIGMVLCGTFFLYLVKGFFKRHPIDKEMHIEITEEEQPVLFEFIHRVCDELGAPEPSRVFVSPDVNAAVMPRTSLVNLFVEPKKDLLIGLGLVNCINLSEFKSVMAHEFGHFSQSAMAAGYAYVVHRIIVDLIEGEDWFDRTLEWCKHQESALKVIGFGIGGCLYVGRMILWWILKLITLQRLAVMRESEFHADLLAVKAAGSDAVALSLFRMRFGNLCLSQAIDDLATALDHKLYSNDIFLHQDRAAAVVRRKRKEPQFGLPPVHDGPMSGKKIRIFDPEEEELVAEDIPEMRRTHPPAHELEESAKEIFIPAVVDHRSPWILFSDVGELKERMSYKLYRMVFRIPKNSELSDAKKVQEYIDNEHADTTYDPKYKGAYDDRKLEPGDLSELNSLIQDSPWTEERMEKVYDKLYDGCREHAEEYSDLRKDLAGLNENVVGKPSPKMKKQIKEVEKKIDENWEWFKSFDRRVYLLYVQMAALVKPAWRQELVERYQFQIEVQKFYEEARDQYDKADAYLTVLFKVDPNELPPDFPGQVIQVLRDAWKGLKKIIHGAREINLPAMKNFEEGENLAEFILPGKMVPEPPLSYVKGVWIDKLFKQLHGVRMRCFRLHTKSLGGILAMQEKIAAAWIASKTNVDAGVVNLVSDLDAVQVVDENDLIEVEMMPTDIHNADHVVGEHVPKGFMFERLKLDDEPAAEEPITVAEVVEDVIEAAEVVEEVPASPFVLPGTPPAPTAAEPAPAVAAFRAAPQPASPPSQANPFEFDLAQGSRPATPPSAGESTELFDLELSDSHTKAAKKADPTDVVFSLDADEISARSSPAPKPASSTVAASPPRPAPPPAPPVPAAEVFSLDPEPAPASTEPPGVVDLGGDSALASPPRTAASAAAPARPAFGSGSGVASALSKESPNGKPTRVKIKRPAVRITFVKPGEKSPLAQ